jgi:hypothetical protein
MSGDSLDDGGPFSPTLNDGTTTVKSGDDLRPTGINVRDWLAGLAMQGLLASGEISVSCEVTAERAYSYADAIIREGKEKMG